MDKKTLLIAALALGAGAPQAAAQEVDLAAQRKEVQHINPVPGKKIDHKGLVINPVPQSVNMGTGTLAVPSGFAYKAKKGDKDYTSDLAFTGIPTDVAGVPLTINMGRKAAKKAAVPGVEGAYLLEILPAGVVINAGEDAGVFYALQTLRQIMESPAARGGNLPVMTVNDWPDLKYRGVVEGFYGTPWSHKVRLSLIDFYGRHKMNNYIYGPKDDPYHSSPNWRLPYPADQAQQIKELIEACDRNRVTFIWAIHPGQDIKWNEEDYQKLLGKLNAMYDLGVRGFSIFFDDIQGEGTDSNKQAELLNRLTEEFVKAKGDVTNIMVCPTDYNESWANPSENGQLAIYGRKLNPEVEVFWTGSAVCADVTPSTMEFVNSRIKRPGLIWWNFPVSDYCRNMLLLGPSYGLDNTLTSEKLAGVESNPMEFGEASKLALYGVADYTWNTEDYNPIDNWERGLQELAAEDPEAFRLLSIHSADTQTGYRRDESWETKTFAIDNYTPAQFNALKEEFAAIAGVPARMEKISNKPLLEELRPWLVEFGKLGNRGLSTLELIKVYEGNDDAAFWNAYEQNIMTEEEKNQYQDHKMGTLKLQPFIDDAKEDMLRAYYHRLSGKLTSSMFPLGSFRTIGSGTGRLMLDGDTTTYYTSGRAQRTGDWIGVDLGEVRPVEAVEIMQGRNSVDDVDYFDLAVLEASADGRTWTPLADRLDKVYNISWTAEPGKAVDARFVRIRKLPSSKTNWAAVRSFRVNPVTAERVGLNVEANGVSNPLRAFDGDPSTTAGLVDSLAFDVPEGASAATLLLGSTQRGTILKQLDAKGNTVATTPLNGSYAKVALSPQASRLALEGNATIYEIIF